MQDQQITAIRLRNFQGQKNRDIEFTPGINAIIGSSDVGKSTIYRSLRFALENSFKRVNVVNHDAKFATVEVDINKHTITRTKGKSKNIYKIDDLTLKAFGSSCPEEIRKVTGLTELNWSSQHGPGSVFLLAETSGNVAKRINEIISLDTIDRSVAFLTKEEKAAKQETVATKNQIDSTEEELESWNYLDEATGFLSKIEQAIDVTEELEHETARVSRLSEDLNSIESSAPSFDLEQAAADLDELKDMNSACSDMRAKTTTVEYHVGTYPQTAEIDIELLDSALARLRLESEKTVDMRATCDRLSLVLSRYQQTEGEDLPAGLGHWLAGLKEQAIDVDKCAKELKKVVWCRDRYRDLPPEITPLEIEAEELALAELKAQYNEKLGHCQTCGQKLPE